MSFTRADLEKLGGDASSKLWKSVTKLTPNMIYSVEKVKKVPKNSVIKVDQIVVETKSFQTALPQRYYTEILMNNDENFAFFEKETHFLVFKGLRKTKKNQNFALINTTLPTYEIGCACPCRKECEKCLCVNLKLSCSCILSNNFEDFDIQDLRAQKEIEKSFNQTQTPSNEIFPAKIT